MSSTDLSDREITALRELLDRRQIEEGIYKYARGVDRTDAELFKSVFWEDGCFDGGPAPGIVHAVADEMINVAVARRFACSQHFFGNILMQFDGDAASVESYAIAYHRTNPNRESSSELLGAERLAELGDNADISYDLIMGIRYVDRWEKRGGVWKLKLRRLVTDWSTTEPSSTLLSGGIMDHLKWIGCRGSADPSYALIRSPL